MRMKRDWTQQEQWVWERISEGAPANFNSFYNPNIFGKYYPKIPNPNNSIEWPETRIIRVAFLKEILASKHFQKKIPPQGIRIIGAWFKEGLNLDNFDSKFSLVFIGCRFEQIVSLNYLVNSKSVEFDNCCFIEEISMNGGRIGGNLFLTSSNFHHHLILRGTEINNQLNFLGSQFRDKVDLNSTLVLGDVFLDSDDSNETIFYDEVDLISASIKGALFMSNSTFMSDLLMDSIKVSNGLRSNEATFHQDITLSNSNMKGNVDFDGSSFLSTLNMNSMQLDNDLFIRSSRLNKVILTGAEIKGDVNLTKAKCVEDLIMDSIHVNGNLFIEKCEVSKSVDLKSSIINGQLILAGSFFYEPVSLNAIQVGKGLIMESEGTSITTFKKEVDLIKAHINQQLNMTGARFYSTLQMSSIEIKGSLLMDGIGTLYSRFDDLNLSGAKIEGQVSINLSLINGRVNMESAYIGEHLLILFSIFISEDKRTDLNLVFTKIGGAFCIAGTYITKMNLAGVRIDKDFSIGFKNHPIHWKNGGELVLTNSFAGAIEDLEASWPCKINFNGFTYEKLGGLIPLDLQNNVGSLLDLRDNIMNRIRFTEPKENDDLLFEKTFLNRNDDVDAKLLREDVNCRNINIPIQDRSVAWFKNWLKQSYSEWISYPNLLNTLPNIKFQNWKNYSPQPYEQLAKVFKNLGKDDYANEILYEKKCEELKSTKSLSTKFILFTQKIFVGFGYRYLYTFCWVVVLILLGSLVAWVFEDNDLVMSIFYSIDRLIPVLDIMGEGPEPVI